MMNCKTVRTILDDTFDDGDHDLCAIAVKNHLTHCPACRDYQRSLGTLQQDIRGLASTPFPDNRLEAVFAQSVDAAPASSGVWSRTIRLSRYATAAALFIAVGVTFNTWQTNEANRKAELAQATAQTKFVLGITADAVKLAETAAVEDIYQAHLAGAFKRFSLDWTKKPLSMFRRFGS